MNLKIIIPPGWNPDNPKNFNKWADKIYKHLPTEKRIEVLRYMP